MTSPAEASYQICPECGASLPEGGTCQDYLDVLLAREFSDPAYFAVHHLSVPAYKIQHPSQLSREGWLAIRQTLKTFVQTDIPPALYRREHRSETENRRRDFRFTTGESLTLPDVRWTRTIAGVRLENAEQYCEDVRQWAAAVIGDTEENQSKGTGDPFPF